MLQSFHEFEWNSHFSLFLFNISGSLRGAKSCRLRWKNYLRANIKRGTMSEDEKDLTIRLHKLLRNWWSLIACRIPGF
ncbi:hypothetical protein Pfo_000531 [Paulownia fortunei]|nr:hypothetical protein Pfo_000531 [Paulownia fortunei]